MVGMLKILIMFLCCFVFFEVPWKSVCTKLFAMIISIVAITLAFNYAHIIVEENSINKTIQVDHNDG